MSRLVYLIVMMEWRGGRGERGRGRENERYPYPQNVCGLRAELLHSPVVTLHGGAVVELWSATLVELVLHWTTSLFHWNQCSL